MTSRSFVEMYNDPKTLAVQFQESWNNGTGYMDGATKLLIPRGQIRKSVTDPINNRKLLLIGTRFGTVVVFERYTDGNNGIYACNWPSRVPMAFKSALNATSSLSEDTICSLVGSRCNPNVGKLIEMIFDKGTDLSLDQIEEMEVT